MSADYKHARDIPDDVFIAAVVVAAQARGLRSATRWDVEAVLGGGTVPRDFAEEFPGVPPKVVLAKASRLIGRRRLRGCTCGCRGDFEIIEYTEES